MADLRTIDFFVRTLSVKPHSFESLWAEHIEHEFRTRSTEKTLATMVEDAYVNHVPVLTGGVGREQLREFYSITSFRRCRPIPPSRLFPARSVTIRSSTK